MFFKQKIHTYSKTPKLSPGRLVWKGGCHGWQGVPMRLPVFRDFLGILGVWVPWLRTPEGTESRDLLSKSQDPLSDPREFPSQVYKERRFGERISQLRVSTWCEHFLRLSVLVVPSSLETCSISINSSILYYNSRLLYELPHSTSKTPIESLARIKRLQHSLP